MRLVLLIIGAVVAQVWHEDDPQDDATRQLWFEEAREAVLRALPTHLLYGVTGCSTPYMWRCN